MTKAKPQDLSRGDLVQLKDLYQGRYGFKSQHSANLISTSQRHRSQ